MALSDNVRQILSPKPQPAAVTRLDDIADVMNYVNAELEAIKRAVQLIADELEHRLGKRM